jgi:Nucleoside-diphosphate-sugar epimerases
MGSLNLVNVSSQYNVKRFIYASTGGAVYGEPRYLPVDEKHIINPQPQYGVSKHTVEHYLFVFRQTHNLPYAVLRYPNVYVPRQDPHDQSGVVAIFIEQRLDGKQSTVLGDGAKERDYVYVGGLVNANMRAMFNDAGLSGEIYNLGWGKKIKDIQVFEAVRDTLDLSVVALFDVKRPEVIDRICLNNTKATKWLEP